MSSLASRGESPFGFAALAAVGVGACCGIPVLVAAGATVTIAGLGVGSWLLIVAGASVAVLAVIWHRRHHKDRERVAKESVDAG